MKKISELPQELLAKYRKPHIIFQSIPHNNNLLQKRRERTLINKNTEDTKDIKDIKDTEDTKDIKDSKNISELELLLKNQVMVQSLYPLYLSFTPEKKEFRSLYYLKELYYPDE